MKTFKEYLKEDGEGEKKPIQPTSTPPQQPTGVEDFSWEQRGGSKWRVGDTWYYSDGDDLYEWIDGEWVCISCDDGGGEGGGEGGGAGGEGDGVGNDEPDTPTKIPDGIPVELVPFFFPKQDNPTDEGDPDGSDEWTDEEWEEYYNRPREEELPTWTDPKKPPPEFEEITPVWCDDCEPPGWYVDHDDGWQYPLQPWWYW